MKKLIHVQEDFVQFQEIKKIGKDEKIANLKDEMNKRKMELEKQKMAFQSMVKKKDNEMSQKL